jgi:hypothetical protein
MDRLTDRALTRTETGRSQPPGHRRAGASSAESPAPCWGRSAGPGPPAAGPAESGARRRRVPSLQQQFTCHVIGCRQRERERSWESNNTKQINEPRAQGNSGRERAEPVGKRNRQHCCSHLRVQAAAMCARAASPAAASSSPTAFALAPFQFPRAGRQGSEPTASLQRHTQRRGENQAHGGRSHRFPPIKIQGTPRARLHFRVALLLPPDGAMIRTCSGAGRRLPCGAVVLRRNRELVGQGRRPQRIQSWMGVVGFETLQTKNSRRGLRQASPKPVRSKRIHAAEYSNPTWFPFFLRPGVVH